MRRKFISGACALATVLTSMTLTVSTSVASAEERPRLCPANGPLNAADMPNRFNTDRCEVRGRRIDAKDISVIVPRSGTAVGGEGFSPRAAKTDALIVEHHTDGLIVIKRDRAGNSADQRSVAAAAPYMNEDSFAPECLDDTYSTPGYREDDTHNWFINTATIPTSDLSVDPTVNAIREATLNINYVRSSCDEFFFGDYWNYNSSLGTHYSGVTNLVANVGDGSCESRDQVNVVSFGHQTEFLAYACWWYNLATNNLIESDVEVDSTSRSWTTDPKSPSCSDEWDVEAVMTHERGHSFGLGHVSESTSPRMTMSTSLDGMCQAQERSLGRGDALGLGSMY